MSVTAASICYSLFIVLFTKSGPATIDKLFQNQFDCQVAEGVMLTKARRHGRGRDRLEGRL